MPRTTSKLKQYGFVKTKNKSSQLFESVISNDFTTIPNISPSEYVKYCWDRFVSSRNNVENATNGKVFELIIETCLYRNAIKPMFLQAKATFVPNVDFDILLYSEEKYPIAISIKTSLRERYKQADLEAIALKYVHRNAKNYLVSLASEETENLKAKIRQGELLGINEIISANTNEFDELVDKLSNIHFIKPSKVDIITGNLIE